MYKIVEKQVLSEVTKLMVVEAPQVARKAKAGQFIIVVTHERGERMPLTIGDYDRETGTITIIFQEVRKSTMEMGLMQIGDGFSTIAGPLGHPTEIENFGNMICVGGGSELLPFSPLPGLSKTLETKSSRSSAPGPRVFCFGKTRCVPCRMNSL